MIAKEIEKLRLESQALKKIKEAMGTEAFPRLLFDKVYKDDIVRLRSMEEMWKTRRPPEPMDYAEVLAKSTDAEARKQKIVKDGQKVWSLEENLVVFKDSLERLSKRMVEMKAATTEGSAEPQITFDKDDEDTLDFVTASANLRSLLFGIETKSRFDIKQMAGNIIPAIATTNAIVAGLCVLQSFKVLKGDYSHTKEVFLSPFAPERLLASDRMRAPNPDCPVCSVAQTRILVDTSRATIGDLVENFLRLELGYGEEIAVTFGDVLLYDPDESEQLEKTFKELSIGANATLTVRDEDDNPRVNLLLSVEEATDLDDKLIKSLDLKVEAKDGEPSSPIPRKPKTPAQANGHGSNGAAAHSNGGETNGVKKGIVRKFDDAFEVAGTERPAVKVKLSRNEKDDVITIEDTDGAILID